MEELTTAESLSALLLPSVPETDPTAMATMAEPEILPPEFMMLRDETEFLEIDPTVDSVTGFAIDETVTYPLDPLTASEIEMAVSVIQQTQNLSEDTFFPRVALQEPPKDEVKCTGEVYI